jgi:hypothetical protein
MTDLTIALEHRPGALAEMGEALGRAGVSVEGGAAFAVGGRWVAHFLVKDGHAARAALEAAGIEVVVARDVLQRLDQGVPEQLGAITRRMAEAGVSIDVLYSDHEHRLVLVVDDGARDEPSPRRGRGVGPAFRAIAGPSAGSVRRGRRNLRRTIASPLGLSVFNGPHLHGESEAPTRQAD